MHFVLSLAVDFHRLMMMMKNVLTKLRVNIVPMTQLAIDTGVD